MKTFKAYTEQFRFTDLKLMLLLLIIIVVGYYNISFLIHPLKWDMIDQAYPYRYFIGESLQNNIFPYWLPFQQSGLPIYSDPQSGVWYPITWIIGYFYGYNIYVISFEYLFHIFLASVGFFLLSKTLGFNKRIAFLLSLCYSFSGFITGNSQHLYYIISAAWVPFVLNSYILMIKREKIIYALSVALFSYLLTTGGYPAFWIILFYHLVLIFLAYAVFLIVKKKYRELITFSRQNITAAIIYLILSLSFLVAVIYNKDQIGRFENVNLESALSFPFSPQCMISFIAPYAVTGNMDFFKTDLSMANAYFGIVAFVFFLMYFFLKKNKLSIIILSAGILNLLVAFGDVLPFRALLYNYVPLMDFLKYPSVFRFFTILSFIITAGYALNTLTEGNRKKLQYVLMVLVAVFISTLFAARFYDYLNLKNMALSLAWKFPNDTSIVQRLAFQLIIQTGLLILFLLMLRLTKIKITLLAISFVLIDLLAATALNSNCTVYYSEFKSIDIRQFEKKTFVKGFPIPDKPIADYSDSTGAYQLFWRNLGIFYKRPAFDGYNPFQIKNSELLKDNHYGFFMEIKKNKLFYFADTVIYGFDDKSAEKLKRPSLVFIEDEPDKAGFSILVDNSITIKDFSPSEISVYTENDAKALLVFLQNYNKGWEASINGHKTEIKRANLTFNSIIVPAGKHEIVFTYKPTPIIVARYVSLSALLIVILTVIYLIFKKNNKAYSNEAAK